MNKRSKRDERTEDTQSIAIAKILAKALRKQYPQLKVNRRGDVVTTTFPARVTPTPSAAQRRG